MTSYVGSQGISNSGLLAVITFGIILGNNDEIRYLFSKNQYIRSIFPIKEWKMSDQIQLFHSEVTFFIKTFMFVSLGILITSSIISVRSILLSALFSCIIYLIRFIILSLLKIKDGNYLAMIVPRGLTQAVVALYIVSVYSSYATKYLVSVVVTIIIVTNIVSSTYLFIKRKEKL